MTSLAQKTALMVIGVALLSSLVTGACSSENEVPSATTSPTATDRVVDETVTPGPASTLAPTLEAGYSATEEPAVVYVPPQTPIPEEQRTYFGEVVSSRDLMAVYNARDIYDGENMAQLLVQVGAKVVAPVSGVFGSVSRQGIPSTVVIEYGDEAHVIIGFVGDVPDSVSPGQLVSKGDVIGMIAEGSIKETVAEANLIAFGMNNLGTQLEYPDLFVTQDGVLFVSK